MQNTPGLPQCGIRDFAKADILFVLRFFFVIVAIYVEVSVVKLVCS